MALDRPSTNKTEGSTSTSKVGSRVLTLSRRHAGLAVVTPFLSSLMAACAAPIPTTTVQNPTLDGDLAKAIMRHVNVLLVGDLPPTQATRFVDIFWSQSCGDTMRAYESKLKSILRAPPKSTIFALHLVARSPHDLPSCISLRSVNQDYYGAAVQAVLEVGGNKRSYVTEGEVTRALAKFPKAGGGFKPAFAENCLKLSQQQALEAGIESTPFFLVDGKPRSLEAI